MGIFQKRIIWYYEYAKENGRYCSFSEERPPVSHRETIKGFQPLWNMAGSPSRCQIRRLLFRISTALITLLTFCPALCDQQHRGK